MTETYNRDNPPLLSIGMPLRNEGRFLRLSLESLVSQLDVEFELVISDNASSDDTAAICGEYCARFPFVRYHRFETNVGSSANFLHVLKEARGHYFMWAAGHDLWDRDYLRVCIDALENNAGAVLAFGSTHWIDEHGADFPRVTGASDTRGLGAEARYFTVLWGNMNPIMGVIRRKNLLRQDVNDMVGIDLALLTSLALDGEFVHVPRNWYRREFRREPSYAHKLVRYRSKEFALSTSFLGRYFPLARLPLRLIGDLFRSRLPLLRKVLVFAVLIISLPVKYVVDQGQRRR